MNIKLSYGYEELEWEQENPINNILNISKERLTSVGYPIFEIEEFIRIGESLGINKYDLKKLIPKYAVKTTY